MMFQSVNLKLAPLLAAAPVVRSTISRLLVAFVTKDFHLMSSPSTSNFKTSRPTLPQIASTNFLSPATPLVEQVAGFKVKGRLRRRCKDCYFVIRQERLYVICKTHPRHKQMAMKPHDDKSWILTHATQSKVRPY